MCSRIDDDDVNVVNVDSENQKQVRNKNRKDPEDGETAFLRASGDSVVVVIDDSGREHVVAGKAENGVLGRCLYYALNCAREG